MSLKQSTCHWYLLLLLLAVSTVGCGATVPVVVSYRDSLVGEGKVAVFSNQTSSRLTITVKSENAGLREVKEGAVDIEPNGKVEIGWLEGWRFMSGEKITVSHPDYRSFTKVIP